MLLWESPADTLGLNSSSRRDRRSVGRSPNGDVALFRGPPSETRRAEESSFYADVAIIGCVVCRNLIHPVTSNGCPCTAHHTDGGSESNGEKRQLACPNACGRPSDAMNIRHRRGSSNARCHRKPRLQKAIEDRGPVSRGGGPGQPISPGMPNQRQAIH